MKIGKKFNVLSKSEYFYYINNHKRFTDFNTLGLYRSIYENEKLTLEEKLEVLEVANSLFKKTYKFLQIKDPETYFKLSSLGKEMTVADEKQLWTSIIYNQKKILEEKRAGHRNFGTFSRHNCGYADCPMNGLMVKKNSWLIYGGEMCFDSDKNRYTARDKSDSRKKQRKNSRRIIEKDIDESV